MTVEEIARLLGVRTQAEVAAVAGVPESSIRPARPEPCLVLDFTWQRGEAQGARWARQAREGLVREAVLPRRLDPRTGLYWDEEKVGRRKKGRR